LTSFGNSRFSATLRFGKRLSSWKRRGDARGSSRHQRTGAVERAAELDLTRIRSDDPAENLDERRFARAVRAHKRTDLAALDRERDVVQRPRRSVRLRQLVDTQRRRASFGFDVVAFA
jgi:hypothetical protein